MVAQSPVLSFMSANGAPQRAIDAAELKDLQKYVVAFAFLFFLSLAFFSLFCFLLFLLFSVVCVFRVFFLGDQPQLHDVH